MLHLHFPRLEFFFFFFINSHSKENYLADATQYLKHSSNLKESHKTTTTTTESKEKKKLKPTLEKNQTRTTTARNEGGKMQSSAKPTNFAIAFDYVGS